MIALIMRRRSFLAAPLAAYPAAAYPLAAAESEPRIYAYGDGIPQRPPSTRSYSRHSRNPATWRPTTIRAAAW